MSFRCTTFSSLPQKQHHGYFTRLRIYNSFAFKSSSRRFCQLIVLQESIFSSSETTSLSQPLALLLTTSLMFIHFVDTGTMHWICVLENNLLLRNHGTE